jgi:hypothetical protein
VSGEGTEVLVKRAQYDLALTLQYMFCTVLQKDDSVMCESEIEQEMAGPRFSPPQSGNLGSASGVVCFARLRSFVKLDSGAGPGVACSNMHTNREIR